MEEEKDRNPAELVVGQGDGRGSGFRNERLRQVEGQPPSAFLGEPLGKEQVLLTCQHLAGWPFGVTSHPHAHSKRILVS